jgi:methyl-accepting chemotaxis protein
MAVRLIARLTAGVRQGRARSAVGASATREAQHDADAEAAAGRAAECAGAAGPVVEHPAPTHTEDLQRLVARAHTIGEFLAATVDGVLSIASAAEELSVSSTEIAMCASEATRVSSDAIRLVGEATDHVGALTANGAETARMTAVIRGLAERTRILSLNTTIEAAHVGGSGRAMAVIASEIRTLAEDAAKGTNAISCTLDVSGQDIAHVGAAITKVAGIATEVQHYQAAIATAVEQQTHVTSEIARAAHEAERQGAELYKQLKHLTADLAAVGGEGDIPAQRGGFRLS